MTDLLPRIAARIQSPTAGALSLLATVLSSAAYIFIPTQYVLRVSLVVVAVASLFIVTLSRRLLPRIQMTCLQENQFFDIEHQHNQVHPFYLGYADIEAYVEIPNWMSEFEMEMDPDGPIEISEWAPGEISRTDDTLVCKNDIDNFKFTFQVIGDEDELGDTTYNLTFENAKTGQEIHSIKLDAKPSLPSVDEDQLSSKEVEEWGVSTSDT